MKKILLTTLCSVLVFSSCEKIAVEVEDENPSVVAGPEYGSAKLNIVTRAGGSDGEENTIAEGRIYIFNSLGNCVQLLSTNEETNQATARLSAGSYNLYAVAGDDLSRFTLPIMSEATPASVIKLLDGKVMDDLMMASADVELEDGETVNQRMELKHKVICLDEIEIKQVPLTVTKVELSLTPLYSSVQLNGDYPATPTESYKISLQKETDGDGKTWKATPNQMLFPSKGNPTIKVSITNDEGTIAYSYNAAEELPANHHISIVGTYKAAQGVTLTGILTDGGWEEDRIITFDFDEKNTAYYPVAGQFCNGYYVVSVDDVHRKAVLLSQAHGIDYVAPSKGSGPELWKQAFVAPMASLEKPENITGSWRLPTEDEARIFTQDPNAIFYDTSEKPYTSITIFCLAGETLKWAESRTEDYETYTFRSGTTGFVEGMYLRPVIDIAY